MWANATQADPGGWQEWKNTFRQALSGVPGQGKIATTATESTIPSDDDDIDDLNMVCFDCEDDDLDLTTACQCCDETCGVVVAGPFPERAPVAFLL